MSTDYDIFTNRDPFVPVIFQSNFNNFAPIDVNQAWSLFFTAGREDKELGVDSGLGKFFTNFLIASAVTVILWGTFFTNTI